MSASRAIGLWECPLAESWLYLLMYTLTDFQVLACFFYPLVFFFSWIPRGRYCFLNGEKCARLFCIWNSGRWAGGGETRCSRQSSPCSSLSKSTDSRSAISPRWDICQNITMSPTCAIFNLLIPKSVQHLISSHNIIPESQEWKKWSSVKESLDCFANSPCQHQTKCIENSMENIHIDVKV